jgi:hypothetical protein
MRDAGMQIFLAALIPIFVGVAILIGPSALQGQAKPDAERALTTLPPGFVRAETCKTCHAEPFERFSTTTMGKLFLKHPRNVKEGLAPMEQKFTLSSNPRENIGF